MSEQLSHFPAVEPHPAWKVLGRSKIRIHICNNFNQVIIHLLLLHFTKDGVPQFLHQTTCLKKISYSLTYLRAKSNPSETRKRWDLIVKQNYCVTRNRRATGENKCRRSQPEPFFIYSLPFHISITVFRSIFTEDLLDENVDDVIRLRVART